jgi:hypothetical protein
VRPRRARNLVRLAVVVALAAAAAVICSEKWGQYFRSPVEPFIEIQSEGVVKLYLPPPAISVQYQEGSQWTEATMYPTGVDRSVVYITTGQKKERIWAIDHPIFDFVKGGDEPLRVLATHLEPGIVVVVYSEFGAVRVSIIQKDGPPPKGTGQWRLAATETLIDNGDIPNRPTVTCRIHGTVGEGTGRLEFTQSNPHDDAPATMTFSLLPQTRGSKWMAKRSDNVEN